VAIIIICGIAAYFLDSIIHFPSEVYSWLTSGILQFAGTILIMALFLKYVDKATWRATGLIPKGGMSVVAGLLTGFFIICSGFVILWLLREITIDGIYFNLMYMLASLIMMLMVAVGEEIIMRGYILRNLMSIMNKYAALLLSALLFSTLHVFNDSFDWFSFIQITLAGILLGISYVYNKKLWFPVALHFSWNFFQGPIFGFNVSGEEVYSLVQQQYKTSNLLNGGAFGFEGSIICTFFMVLAIMVIACFFKKHRQV
jgi:membrane protease YdiL (CAAX protease family)